MLLYHKILRHIDFKVTSSGCHSVLVLSTTVGYSLVAMVTDLFRDLPMIREKRGIQCMPSSFRIISEMQPEIHTMEKFYFLKSIIHSQIFNSLFDAMRQYARKLNHIYLLRTVDILRNVDTENRHSETCDVLQMIRLVAFIY